MTNQDDPPPLVGVFGCEHPARYGRTPSKANKFGEVRTPLICLNSSEPVSVMERESTRRCPRRYGSERSTAGRPQTTSGPPPLALPLLRPQHRELFRRAIREG